MLDRAQEVKRKWDPEPSKGKKISTTKTLARDDFIYVAKVVNISVLEGSLEEKTPILVALRIGNLADMSPL